MSFLPCSHFQTWSCSKFRHLSNILKFGQNSEICAKFWNLVKILIFGQNSEIWSNFWKDGQNCETSWFGMVCMVDLGLRALNFITVTQSVTDQYSYQGRHRAARAANKQIYKYRKIMLCLCIFTKGQRHIKRQCLTSQQNCPQKSTGCFHKKCAW